MWVKRNETTCCTKRPIGKWDINESTVWQTLMLSRKVNSQTKQWAIFKQTFKTFNYVNFKTSEQLWGQKNSITYLVRYSTAFTRMKLKTLHYGKNVIPLLQIPYFDDKKLLGATSPEISSKFVKVRSETTKQQSKLYPECSQVQTLFFTKAY